MDENTKNIDPFDLDNNGIPDYLEVDPDRDNIDTVLELEDRARFTGNYSLPGLFPHTSNPGEMFIIALMCASIYSVRDLISAGFDTAEMFLNKVEENLILADLNAGKNASTILKGRDGNYAYISLQHVSEDGISFNPDDVRKIAKNNNIPIAFDYANDRVYVHPDSSVLLAQLLTDAFKRGEIGANSEFTIYRPDDSSFTDSLANINEKIELGEGNGQTLSYLVDDLFPGRSKSEILKILDCAGIVYNYKKENNIIEIPTEYKESIRKIQSVAYNPITIDANLISKKEILDICNKNDASIIFDHRGNNNTIYVSPEKTNVIAKKIDEIVSERQNDMDIFVDLSEIKLSNDVIEQICKNNDIEYTIDDNTLTIKQKDYTLLENVIFDEIVKENNRNLLGDDFDDYEDVLRELEDNSYNYTENTEDENEPYEENEEIEENLEYDEEEIEEEKNDKKKKEKKNKKGGEAPKPQEPTQNQQNLYNAATAGYLEEMSRITAMTESDYNKQYNDPSTEDYNRQYNEPSTNNYNNEDSKVDVIDNSTPATSPNDNYDGYVENYNYTGKLDEAKVPEISGGGGGGFVSRDEIRQDAEKQKITFNDGSSCYVKNGSLYDGKSNEKIYVNSEFQSSTPYKDFVRSRGGVKESSYHQMVSTVTSHTQKASYQQQVKTQNTYINSQNKNYQDSLQKLKENNYRQQHANDRSTDPRTYSGYKGGSAKAYAGNPYAAQNVPSSTFLNPYIALSSTIKENVQTERQMQIAGAMRAGNVKLNGTGISGLYNDKRYMMQYRQNLAAPNVTFKRFGKTNDIIATSSLSYSGQAMRGIGNSLVYGTYGIRDFRNDLQMVGTFSGAGLAVGNLRKRAAQHLFSEQADILKSTAKMYGIKTIQVGGREYKLDRLGDLSASNFKVYQELANKLNEKADDLLNQLKGLKVGTEQYNKLKKEAEDLKKKADRAKKELNKNKAGIFSTRRMGRQLLLGIVDNTYGVGMFVTDVTRIVRYTKNGIKAARSIGRNATTVHQHIKNLRLHVNALRTQKASVKMNRLLSLDKNSKNLKKIDKLNKKINRLDRSHNRIIGNTRIGRLRTKIAESEKALFKNIKDQLLKPRYPLAGTKLGDKLGKIGGRIGGIRNKITNFFKPLNDLRNKLASKIIEKLAIPGAKILAIIAAIVVITAILYAIMMSILSTSSDPEYTTRHFIELVRLETGLYDPDHLGLTDFGANTTLTELFDKDPAERDTGDYPIVIQAGYNTIQNSFTGYLRVKDNCSGKWDDLASTDLQNPYYESGTKAGGEEGGKYVTGFYNFNEKGEPVDVAKLRQWYRHQAVGDTGTSVPVYDGISYVNVKTDMRNKTGLSSNILSILAMSTYVFNQDLATAGYGDISETTSILLANPDKYPEGYVPFTVDIPVSVSDNNIGATTKKTIWFKSKSGDTLNQNYVQFAINQHGLDRDKWNSDLVSDIYHDLTYMTDEELCTYLNEKTDLGNARTRAENHDRQDKISLYISDMYALSHQLNISLNPDSYSEIAGNTNPNLQNVVDSYSDPVNVEKYHKTIYTGEGQMKSIDVDKNGEACDSCLTCKLDHDGLVAVLAREYQYVDTYTNGYGGKPVKRDGSAECIHDIEALEKTLAWCEANHYIPAEYTTTITYDVMISTYNTKTGVHTGPDLFDQRTKTIVSYAPGVSYEANADGEYCDADGNELKWYDPDQTYEAKTGEIMLDIPSSETHGKEIRTFSIGNVTRTGAITKPESYLCIDEPTDHNLHTYTHCGGHFQLQLEVFTSDYATPNNKRDLFGIDDYSEKYYGGQSLAELYGENWTANTDGRNRWRSGPKGIIDGRYVKDSAIVEFAEALNQTNVAEQLGINDSLKASRAVDYKYDKNFKSADGETFKKIVPQKKSYADADPDAEEGGDPTGRLKYAGSLTPDMRYEILKQLTEQTDSVNRKLLMEQAVYAVGQIGYYFGGSSNAVEYGCYPQGLDCSGFVCWLYHQWYAHHYLIHYTNSAWRDEHPLATNLTSNILYFRASAATFSSNYMLFEPVSYGALKPGDVLLKTGGAATNATSSNHAAVYLGHMTLNLYGYDDKHFPNDTPLTGYWYIQEGGDAENTNIRYCPSLEALSAKFGNAVRFKHWDYFDEIDIDAPSQLDE